MTDAGKMPPVSISSCSTYDTETIRAILRKHFSELGITHEYLAGKKIVLKPNLVIAREPERAATTHPAVVEAVYDFLTELGADNVILAESPGGPYTSVSLNRIYRITGMTEIEGRKGIPLNGDYSFRKMSFSGGRKLKEFDVITPIADADIIFNLCKLKTHSLTGLSCAVKNLFGVIPGTLKIEMHAAYPKLDVFSEMLVDLNFTLSEKKKIVSICDAVVSMEGNGPTNGTPVETGLILSSENAFALDVVAEKLVGLEGETKYLDIGCERLGIPRRYDGNIGIEGRPEGLRRPDSKAGALLRGFPDMFGGLLGRFIEPKPKISARCVGCGKCVESCPQKTIQFKVRKGKKVADISYRDCIRCYCCQELCPYGAVDTAKNALLRLIH